MQEQKLREALEAENEAIEEAELEDVESIDDEDEDEDEETIETGGDVNRQQQVIAAVEDGHKPVTEKGDE